MFKNYKYVKLICIVLVFSALALALSVGMLAINALRVKSFDDPLDGYDEELEEEKETNPPIIPPIGPGGPSDVDGNETPYRVRSDATVPAVYLRSEAFGEFNGKEWLPAAPYVSLMDEKYPATYLSSKMIEAWDFADPIALEVVSYNDIAAVPLYTATDEKIEEMTAVEYTEEYPIPSDDISVQKPTEEYYRLFYYNYDDISTKSWVPLIQYSSYEKDYRAFVENNYLFVDEETREYMLGVIEKEKFDLYSYDLAETVAAYISGIGEYLLDYDTKLDEEENVVISFMETYKNGTCKHFASAATLLFRTMNIPARYVIGFMSETVAGEWVTLDKYDAHAWVEIYIDGFGWKTVEVTPQQQTELICVKPVDVKKPYDGTPLLPEQKIEGFAEYESKGYTYEVVISGERTEPGIGESIIEEIKIFDKNGEDVTGMFTIEKRPGKLAVLIDGITLRSGSISQTYNGIPRSSELSTCDIIYEDGVELLDGHTIRMEAKELPTKIGYHAHAFSVIVEDADGNDVTDMYLFGYSFGTFEVKPITITIEAKSASKQYDTSPLICDEYILDGVLIEGDVIQAIEGETFVSGEQLYPGESPNIINASNVCIVDKDGNDVTSNYIIKTKDGKLTVYE